MTHDRNYFTFERLTEKDTQIVTKISDRMVELGIEELVNTPDNLSLDKEDQKYKLTDGFHKYFYMRLEQIFWHIDPKTGGLKEFANPKKKKAVKKRHQEYEHMRQTWAKNGGDPEKFEDYYMIETITDIILEYKIINEILNRADLDPADDTPIPIPMDKIFKIAQKEQELLDEQNNNEYRDMARLIHGWKMMKLETRQFQRLSRKLVTEEIMTDTGHLNRTFLDCIKYAANDEGKSMEQVTNDSSLLFAVIAEYTREGEDDSPKEILNKLGKEGVREIDEMVTVVKRCLLLELQKQKEESQ